MRGNKNSRLVSCQPKMHSKLIKLSLQSMCDSRREPRRRIKTYKRILYCLYCRCPLSPLHSSKWCWFIPFNGRDYTDSQPSSIFSANFWLSSVVSVWQNVFGFVLAAGDGSLAFAQLPWGNLPVSFAPSRPMPIHTFSIHIIVLMQSRNLDNETKQLLCRLLHSTMRSNARARARILTTPCIHCLFILFAVRIRRLTHTHIAYATTREYLSPVESFQPPMATVTLHFVRRHISHHYTTRSSTSILFS